MKKYLNKLVLLILAFILVSGIEFLYKEKSPQIEMIVVYVANQKIDQGSYLTNNMMTSVSIPKNLLTEHMLRQPIKGYLKNDIEVGEFIYHHQISQVSPIEFKENHRMITVKCDIVSANGWLFDLNEIVDLVMVNGDHNLIIENAKICRIFNDNISGSEVPNYISLIVNEKEANTYFNLIAKSQVYLSKKE